MDLYLGTKRIKSICKGSKYIPGLMVNGRLWHGSPGTVRITNDEGAVVSGKAYYGLNDGSLINITVSSGGVLHDTTIMTCSVYVQSGGSVTGYMSQEYASWLYVSGGTVAYNHINNDRASAFITSGGVIQSCTAKGGKLEVISGGSLQNVTFIENETPSMLYIHNGGFLQNTVAGQGCVIYVSSGGTANAMTVDSTGYLTILSGGTALNVTSSPGANITVDSGGSITYA